MDLIDKIKDQIQTGVFIENGGKLKYIVTRYEDDKCTLTELDATGKETETVKTFGLDSLANLIRVKAFGFSKYAQRINHGEAETKQELSRLWK